MTIVSRPIVNITKSPATTSISNKPQRVLIVGQQTGSTYTSGQLVENIGNNVSDITAFGAGSHIAEMIKRFKQTNEVTRLDAIPLDDNGAAVSATATVAFTGTATEAGTFTVNIGSRYNHSYEIAVESGDTADEVGDALVTAITDDTYKIVTGVNTTGSVALTAVNGGTTANKYSLQLKGAISGLTTSITQFSGGATDPVLTTLFDVIEGERYQTIVFPNAYDVTVVADTITSTTSLLDPRWNVENDILDGVAIVYKTDTLANLKSAGDARNSQSLVIRGNKPVNETLYKGSAKFELDDVLAAGFAAVRALRLTEDATLGNFTAIGSLETVGGAQYAPIPYFNTPFDFPAEDIGKGWTASEIKDLNASGISVDGSNVARNSTIIGQTYTTYSTDSAGNPDTTYQYLNRVDQHSVAAEYFYNNSRRDFAQKILTSGPIESTAQVTERQIIAQFVDYYDILSGPDYLIVRSDQESRDLFKKALEDSIQIDFEEGRVTANMDLFLASQLRRLDATLKSVLA